MSRRTFAEVEYEGKKKQTRREKFLWRMKALIPWERPAERIRPYYPQAGRVTRSGRRLRVLFARSNYRLGRPLYAAKRLEPT